MRMYIGYTYIHRKDDCKIYLQIYIFILCTLMISVERKGVPKFSFKFIGLWV